MAKSLVVLVNLSLDELIPANHFYRILDRTLDLETVCDLVRTSHSKNRARSAQCAG